MMNKQKIAKILVFFLVSFSIILSTSEKSISQKPKAEDPKYGGTLTLVDRWTARGYDPISWNMADWNWLQTWPRGFIMEGLLVGDIDKYGPRGSNQFDFSNWDGATY